jgi:hypothetical protein
MQDIYVKLNTGLPWQKASLNKKKTFGRQIGLKFNEETSKTQHLEQRFVGC